MRLVLVLLGAASCRSVGANWVPPFEYDDVVEGRGVVLQLLIHDQAANDTRAKWRALYDRFASSSEVVVGRLFCDGDGEALCGELLNGRLLSAFPSVFYGDPYELSEYGGDKSLEALAALAEAVRAPCSHWRRDRCDARERKSLEAYWRMPRDDLDELMGTTAMAHLARVDDIEDDLTAKRADLLAEWAAHEEIFSQRVARVEPALRTLYQVAAERGALPPPPPPPAADDEGTYAADGLADGYLDGAYADELYGDEYDDVYYYDAGNPYGAARPPTLYYDGDPYDDGYDGAYAGDGYYEDQSYMTQASASVPRR